MMYPTALVTGGSRGIGKAIVQQLFEQGYNVAINYFRSETCAVELAAELNKHSLGNKAIAICADVSNASQVKIMFEETKKHLGTVSLLVNNTGISQQKLFSDITEAEWDTMFSVNVKSMFLCCRQALTDMIHNKNGKIINISSMWGQVGASCEVHYSASKAAVIGLTKALAKEVGPSHIQVNCVAPGVIKTAMNSHLDKQTLEMLKEETPLGVIGTTGDVAQMVGFLASDHSDFITGQVFGINGGMVI